MTYRSHVYRHRPQPQLPTCILLRESFRRNGKVKNRTLANLSHWLPARIEALRRLLHGEFDQAAEFSRAPQLGGVFGRFFVLQQIAEALGHRRRARSPPAGETRSVPGAGPRRSPGLAPFGRALRPRIRRWRKYWDWGSSTRTICMPLWMTWRLVGKLEKTLYRRYLARRGQPPRLFLYDVTSSYLEGEKNELGEYGYNRDGKRGSAIAIGLLAARKANRWPCGCSKETAVIPPWGSRFRFCRNDSGWRSWSSWGTGGW